MRLYLVRMMEKIIRVMDECKYRGITCCHIYTVNYNGDPPTETNFYFFDNDFVLIDDKPMVKDSERVIRTKSIPVHYERLERLLDFTGTDKKLEMYQTFTRKLKRYQEIFDYLMGLSTIDPGPIEKLTRKERGWYHQITKHYMATIDAEIRYNGGTSCLPHQMWREAETCLYDVMSDITLVIMEQADFQRRKEKLEKTGIFPSPPPRAVAKARYFEIPPADGNPIKDDKKEEVPAHMLRYLERAAGKINVAASSNGMWRGIDPSSDPLDYGQKRKQAITDEIDARVKPLEQKMDQILEALGKMSKD